MATTTRHPPPLAASRFAARTQGKSPVRQTRTLGPARGDRQQWRSLSRSDVGV